MLDTDQVSSMDLLQDTAEPLSQDSGVSGKTLGKYLSKGIKIPKQTGRGATKKGSETQRREHKG